MKLKRSVAFLLAGTIAILSLPTSSLATVPTSQAGSPATTGGWVAVQSSLLSLKNSRTWVVQGEMLSTGSCGYRLDNAPREVPVEGWVRQTIAFDQTNCRELIEEGNPTDQVAFRALAGIPAAGSATPATGRRGAWQSVLWFDVVGIQLTLDTTQIYWSYDGTTVYNGTTTAYCNPLQSWWYRDYCNQASSYPPGSYLGQSSSGFHTLFCAPLPTTYVYYYYNRVWGHPDGTAAIAQSSTSVNACLPLHPNVYAGYN